MFSNRFSNPHFCANPCWQRWNWNCTLLQSNCAHWQSNRSWQGLVSFGGAQSAALRWFWKSSTRNPRRVEWATLFSNPHVCANPCWQRLLCDYFTTHTTLHHPPPVRTGTPGKQRALGHNPPPPSSPSVSVRPPALAEF